MEIWFENDYYASDKILHKCFGSGSGSMCILIEMALRDPDPYWKHGSGSGFRTVKMVSKKENKYETSSLNEH